MFLEKVMSVVESKKHLQNLHKWNPNPTVLYGAGQDSIEVRNFLLSHSINVVENFVDYEYLGNTLNKTDAKTFDEIKTKYKKFNIAIAFYTNIPNAFNKIKEHKCEQVGFVNVFDCSWWQRFKNFDYSFLEENVQDFQKTYDWLEDDLSKRTFIEFINTKLSYNCLGS
jgi:hypothetical protein